ncbi:MAG: imidazolonepropionase [bacterium]|nr:imidazolonepropionase [bacterium]
MDKKLLIINIGSIFAATDGPKRGTELDEPTISERDAILCINGKIAEIGDSGMLLENHPFAEVVDTGGRLATPGFVDSHTHLVFGGDRSDEYEMRTRGVSYMEIFEAGGGILSSVRATLAARDDELFDAGHRALREMVMHGTTTVEAKSGYGPDTETELRQLRVIKKLGELGLAEIVPTFLGAHALPLEYKDNRDGFIGLVVKEMIPAVVEENLAEYCDVFCDRGAFTVAEAERVLRAALDAGLKIRVHADEFEALGIVPIAVEMGAASCDHLAVANEESVPALADSDTVATVLPGTSIYLGGHDFAPARKLIDSGCIFAIASDFNPGSCTAASVRTVLSPAAVNMKITPTEIVHSVTCNPAYSLGRGERKGFIAPGYDADIAIWNARSVNELIYRWSDPRAWLVARNGDIVYRDDRVKFGREINEP